MSKTAPDKTFTAGVTDTVNDKVITTDHTETDTTDLTNTVCHKTVTTDLTDTVGYKTVTNLNDLPVLLTQLWLKNLHVTGDTLLSTILLHTLAWLARSPA